MNKFLAYVLTVVCLCSGTANASNPPRCMWTVFALENGKAVSKEDIKGDGSYTLRAVVPEGWTCVAFDTHGKNGSYTRSLWCRESATGDEQTIFSTCSRSNPKVTNTSGNVVIGAQEFALLCHFEGST